MVERIPNKYRMFAFFIAFLTGCFIAAFHFLSFYTLIPLLILTCFLIYTNRRNRAVSMLPILLLVLLLGGFEYYHSSSKQSSLNNYIGKTAVIEGIVLAEPIETQYGHKMLLKKVYYIENNKYYKCAENLLVYTNKEDSTKFGDHIRLVAEVETIAKLKNFGDFNFEKYYASKNIYVKAYPKTVAKIASNKAGFVSTLLNSCSQKVKGIIFAALPKTEAALLHGILTGSKSDIDEEVLEVFSLTGLAHILSVSGLHIGFLVLMLTYILKPLKLEKKLHGIIIFVTVLFYILMIGAPVPAVRALLMLAVMLGGSIWGRKYDLNASASFAALVLIIYNPLLIHDPSYIISFACIYSISFFHQPINNKLRFLPTWVRSSFALSIAVWIGITPVLVYYFNYVSIINILLNMLAVPLSFAITLAGFAAVLIGIFIPSVSIFVFAVSFYLLRILYFISEKSLLLPYTGFNIPALGIHIYILYYLAVLMLIEDFWKYRSFIFKRYYITVCTIGFCIVIALNFIPKSQLEIYFVDVGQGDCSVIKTPNRKIILVDGGGSSDWEKDSYDIGRKVTVPALLHIGVIGIDTVLISHIHDDHMGGIISVLESFKVGQVMLPASDNYGEGEFSSINLTRLIEICKKKKIPITYLEKGNSLLVGNMKLKVLWPEKPYIKNTDADLNNNSLVFKLQYKNFDALFTGDIQEEAEQCLTKENLSCDLLKVAHHGSPYSSTENFLKKADPEISIISVGRNNYGHPSKFVIERLDKEESKIYRTDEKGAVMLTTKGGTITIKTVR